MKLPFRTLQKLALAGVGAAALALPSANGAETPGKPPASQDAKRPKDKKTKPQATPSPVQPPEQKPERPPCPACGLG